MKTEAQALWTLADIAAAVEGTAFGRAETPISGISIDTRTLEPGDLFIALRGPNFDGHQFVPAALAAGAAAVLVETGFVSTDIAAKTIRVGDTQLALEALGRAARARSQAQILAVTGSVGKTSTKEMLAVALAACGVTHCSGGSLNNHWGVPLSLARLPEVARFGVFELGMNHAGEITALTAQVRPHIALITTVEPAHLEFFSSVEAIADAKAEIFTGIEPDGTAILNRDNPHFARLGLAARKAGIERIVDFGADDAAAARLVGLTPTSEGSTVDAILHGRRLRYRLGLAGRHMALNSLAALAAVDAAGGDPAIAAEALASLSGLAGRGRRLEIAVKGGTALLIDESYNASPASVRAALAVLGAIQTGVDGRRIAVLGDMRELGAQGPDLHRALSHAIEEAEIDQLFAVGPLMRGLWQALPPGRRGDWAETAADLVSSLAVSLRPGDVVMVKGSFGIRMADIVKPLMAGLAAGGASC